MVTRAGHTLAELIVTLTVLAATVGAVAASAVTGAGWSARAGARQDALVAARAVLDSVVAGAPPTAGGTTRSGYLVVWSVTSGGAGVRLHLTSGLAGKTPLVELVGLWTPPPRSLGAP